MALSVDQIAREVSALPREARAELADRLVEILDPVDWLPLQEAWGAEAIRRRDDVRDGRVLPISGEEAFSRVRRALGE
jgi:putative addiction module component (TIGR02574 family)